MGDMQWGWMRITNTCGVLAVALGATLGCSSSSDGGSSCGTAQKPATFTLKDVSPAAGSSVPNSDIVLTFTVVGQLLSFTPPLALHPSLHTAGEPTPNPIHWSASVSGNDIIYTAEPITWATAPGHVQLIPSAPVQDPSNCVWTLPTPTFSYDVTAP